jgi:hypothetical protein
MAWAMLACLLPAQRLLAGNCASYVKLNAIANIQTDGDDVLVRSSSFQIGSDATYSFNINGATTLNSYVTFRIEGARSADFKKNSLATLLSAKAMGEIVYLQLYYISQNVYGIDKAAIGPSALGLECLSYKNP